MARIAFDISDQAKQEIKVRLAREKRTLSDVMRVFCSHYKNFGLYPGHQVDWKERNTLPNSPGVYFVYAEGKLQYIGRTASLHQRLNSGHHRGRQFARLKASIFWIEAPVDILAELESWLIKTLEPPLNGSPTETSISISLPPWLKERVEKEAERELSTMSQVVRKILAEKFEDENEGQGSPRRVTGTSQ